MDFIITKLDNRQNKQIEVRSNKEKIKIHKILV
jgi:hypothetical protein